MLPSSKVANLTAEHRRGRMLKDVMAKWVVGFGGISVIAALLLIFIYLLYVSLPLFSGAKVDAAQPIEFSGQGKTLHLAFDEYSSIAARFNDAGGASFVELKSGKPLLSSQLNFPAPISSFFVANPAKNHLFYGLNDGQVRIGHYGFKISYDAQHQKTLEPEFVEPFSGTALQLDATGQPLSLITGQVLDEQAIMVGLTADHRLLLGKLEQSSGGLDDETSWQFKVTELELALDIRQQIDRLLLNSEGHKLFVTTRDNRLFSFDLKVRPQPRLLDEVQVGSPISSVALLAGGHSIVIGHPDGHVSQWFHVRDAQGQPRLKRIREFSSETHPVTFIAPEQARKSFMTLDGGGQFALYHATAERNLLVQDTGLGTLTLASFSPRADAVLIEDQQGKIFWWRIHNEHPEISWSALWGKVWYEGYDQPDYIWQSSSASNDFEPKFSLTPVSFGTLKAAFYAMLVAVPIAVFGAIYAAYFMTPQLRQWVKPTVEIMAALPSVILGFLAGLWLAPFMEKHLMGMFCLVILTPLGVIFSSLVWHCLAPERLRNAIQGWELLLLVPLVLLLVFGAYGLSPALEQAFFAGDIRAWLDSIGLPYTGRNALIVGIAMGFAVIPTIFTLAEDAIYAVPKSLTTGSLALGATPWQTLVRVVLLNASPGIFSAIMVGLGRAVGETMIVLMATGNTAVMDASIFQGLRTLSANIAVEMPESEVGSTHYRILFLAALVLFLFTFVVNTFAELVRQHLRKKYTAL